ncbi:hypothetical protein [Pararhodobacter sp. SW119]|uniref:hypothetical protein n=1 Tax=Pararhodobacter sp. SW119 TaxID=2780075 RepID=UPI001AE076C0|nr:hypothetical protein [Pararhodobacter sp. SW119]
MSRPLIAAVLTLGLGACVLPEDQAPRDTACPVIASADWTAFVNAMPGPQARPELIVTGTVTLPSAGYAAELRPGPTDRSARPVQTVMLEVTPPDGPAAMVLSEIDLRLSMPALSTQPGAESAYRGVRVLCEGSELAFIAPVETAW